MRGILSQFTIRSSPGTDRLYRKGRALSMPFTGNSHALAESLTSEKFEAVMHFAAFIEAGESMKKPGRFYQNNLVNSCI